MKVLNIHTRIIDQPIKSIIPIFESLASQNDRIFPIEHWSKMKLFGAKKVGTKAGHGIIKYTISKYISGKIIQFEFTSPKGFKGHHKFELSAIDIDKTELTHVINMKTTGHGTFFWIFVIRWLHDALLEDCLDKVENHFLTTALKSKWSPWVEILRWLFKAS